MFVTMFRWVGKLIGFFISGLKIIFTIAAVLVVIIIPTALMLPITTLKKIMINYRNKTPVGDALVTVTNKLVIWTRVLALVGVFAFSAAVLQWCALVRTDETTREAFTAVQRAFVTVTELTMEPTNDKNGKVVSWMFKPQVINTGSTPTKDMEYSSIGSDGPTNPTEGWSNPYPNVKFPESPSDPDNVFNLPKPFKHGHAVLAPHATMHIALGGEGIGVDLLKKYIDEGWRSYIYGVIHYNDIFFHSEPHVTKYCYTIGVSRNDKGEIVPSNGLCAHWNCVDDECRTDRDAWVAEITDAFAKAGRKVPEEVLFGPSKPEKKSDSP